MRICLNFCLLKETKNIEKFGFIINASLSWHKCDKQPRWYLTLLWMSYFDLQYQRLSIIVVIFKQCIEILLFCKCLKINLCDGHVMALSQELHTLCKSDFSHHFIVNCYALLYKSAFSLCISRKY